VTLNHGLAKYNAHAALAMFEGMVKDYANNKHLNKIEREVTGRYLQSRGINLEKLQAWHERGMVREGDAFFESQYKQAAINSVSDSVMLPRAATVSKWQQIPHIRFMWHVTKYVSQVGNTITARMIDDGIMGMRQVARESNKGDFTGALKEAAVAGSRGVKALETLALMSSLGYLGYVISDWVKHGDRGSPYPMPDSDRHPVEFYSEVLRRSGLAGLPDKWLGVLQAPKYGRGYVESVAPLVSSVEDGLTAMNKFTETGDKSHIYDYMNKWGPGILAAMGRAEPRVWIPAATAWSLAIKNRETKEEILHWMKQEWGTDSEAYHWFRQNISGGENNK